MYIIVDEERDMQRANKLVDATLLCELKVFSQSDIEFSKGQCAVR